MRTLPTIILLAAPLLLAAQTLPIKASAAEPYAVRRSVPYRPGDSWRTEIHSVEETTGKVVVGGAVRKADERVTTQVTALVRVVDVDSDGFATKWTAKIAKCEKTERGRRRQVLLRPGAEIELRRRNGQVLARFADGAALADNADEIRRLLSLSSRDDDSPVEPPQPAPLGAKWKGDAAAMKKAIVANGPPQLREHPDVFTISSSGALGEEIEKLAENKGVATLRISFRINTKLSKVLETENQFLEEMESVSEETSQMPADYSTDFLSRTTVENQRLVASGKGRTPDLNVTVKKTTTERRYYLEFNGGGVRPWRSITPVANPSTAAMRRGLLTGLSFDRKSIRGAGKDMQIAGVGATAGPFRIKSSGNATGRVGEALRLDGKDDHIRLSGVKQALRSGADEITVAVWVQSPSRKIQFLLDVGHYADSSLSLLLYEGKLRFTVPPKAGGVVIDTPVDASRWTHLAATWDGKRQQVYVNGKQIADMATVKPGRLDPKTLGDLDCLVGAQSKESKQKGRYLAGQLDELGVWTRAMSAAEIAAVYEHGERGESWFSK